MVPQVASWEIGRDLRHHQVLPFPSPQLLLKPNFNSRSHEYTDSHADSDEVIVVMDTFKSKIIRVKVKFNFITIVLREVFIPQVSKKPGMEMEDLLSESGAQADQGLWDSISRYASSNIMT